MITKEELDEVMHRIKLHSSDAASIMIKENDKKLLLFYSLGFLADMYADAGEDLLKKGEEYAATYYAGKSSQIHQFAGDVFGMVPQKEYYKKTPFKALNIRTDAPVAEIQQLAQFAAANVQADPEVLGDEDVLIPTIKQLFKKHNRIGIEYKYVEVLRKTFNQLVDKPPKLEIVYELLLLLENIDMIRTMIKEQKQKEKQDDILFKTKREKRYGK